MFFLFRSPDHRITRSPDPQVWLGKTPNSEMMKLITRNGNMLSCGCEPPAEPKAWGAMFPSTVAVSSNCPNEELAHTLPLGLACVPAPELHCGTWPWAGICEVVSVTVSAPPVCPSAKPGPTCTGTRLCRFGNAKLFSPSPPYVVPINWKSVGFWSMGTSAPLQNDQPAGAKFPANILISPTNGPDMCFVAPHLFI